MAYKINIRNVGNTGWINLLEAQYHEVLDSGSRFTAADVENVLVELFDNKAHRVSTTTTPGASTDSYQVGTVWVNTSTDDVYICVDNTTSNAIWLNISSVSTEGIEDIVGAMIDAGVNTNITASYIDASSRIDFAVATATTSVLGVASFNSSFFTVTTGAVSIANDAITANQLAHTIDATSIGFNADKVDGRDINDSGESTNDIWTASKVKSYVDALSIGLDWKESVIDKDLSTPPGTPATGDRYIVGASGTGAWSGHDNQIAEWSGSAWVFDPADEGNAAWVEDEDIIYVYNGTAWIRMSGTVTHANLAGLQGGTGAEFYHLTNAEHTALVGSKTANYVFASPSDSAGVGGFRALVATDIPTLTSAKISDFVEAAQDAVGAAITDGTKTRITVTYNDASNLIDFTVPLATTTSGTPGVASFSNTYFTVDGAGHVSLSAAPVADHGGLTGLGDDDHPHYVHLTTARSISARHTFAPVSANSPFILSANAQGQLVTGLNADLLNGRDWTVAVTASAPSSPAANDIWIEITP